MKVMDKLFRHWGGFNYLLQHWGYLCFYFFGGEGWLIMSAGKIGSKDVFNFNRIHLPAKSSTPLQLAFHLPFFSPPPFCYGTAASEFGGTHVVRLNRMHL
jgi:hypothetical protein